VSGFKDGRSLASYLFCSSVLEEESFRLYDDLAKKVDLPLVRSFLLHIAHDSRKHGELFRGMGESVFGLKKKPRDCAKRLGEVWRAMEEFSEEVSQKKTISVEEWPRLAERLKVLESLVGEEYYVLVQAKTLQFMTREINRLYSVDMGSVKGVLSGIIKDEEHHVELLGMIKKALMRKRKTQSGDEAAMVKYQHPDSWIRPLPG